MTANKPNLRKMQKAMTLSLIRDSARNLFYTKPFDGITIDHIASAAGVSRATVYLHFSNKHEILLDILAENLGDQMAIYRALTDIKAVNRSSIREWLQRYRDLMDKHHAVRHLFSIAIMLMPDRQNIASNHREQAIAILGERFEGFSLAKLKGEKRERKRVQCYLMLFQLEHSCSNFSVFAEMPDINIGLEVLADKLLDYCLNGAAPHKKQAS